MSSELENLHPEILKEIVSYAGILALGHLKKTSKALNQKLSVESLSPRDIIDLSQSKGMSKFIAVYQKTESYKKLEQAHEALKKLNPQDLNENQQQTLLAYIFVTDDIHELNPDLIKKLTLDDAMRLHMDVVVPAINCGKNSLFDNGRLLKKALHKLPQSPRYFLNLSKANLGGVILDGANLEGANLHKADLEGAYLYKADLCGAYLTDTRFIAFSGFIIRYELDHWVKQTEGHKYEKELRKAIANDLIREATKKEKKNPKLLEDALKHEMFGSKPFSTFFGYYKDKSREALIKAKNELSNPAAVPSTVSDPQTPSFK